MKAKISRKLIINTLIIIVVSIIIKVAWFNFLKILEYEAPPRAIKGVLDIRELELSDIKTMPLNGEWEYYPNQLITTYDANQETTYLNMGKRYNKNLINMNKEDLICGSYRLTILLDQGGQQDLVIKIKEKLRATRVYINGNISGGAGDVEENIIRRETKIMPYTIKLESDDESIEIIVQVSDYKQVGEIIRPIRLGTSKAIDRRMIIGVALQLLTAFVIMANGMAAILLRILGLKNKSLNYLALVSLVGAIAILVAGEMVLSMILKLNYSEYVKLIKVTYSLSLTISPIFFYHLLDSDKYKRAISIFTIISAIYILVTIFGTVSLKSGLSIGHGIIVTGTVLTFMIIWAAAQDNQDLEYLFYASLLIAINMTYSFIKDGLRLDLLHYPFNIVMGSLAFSVFWIKKFVDHTNKMQDLASKLQEEHKNKDKFLINTSHEIRTPLHGIMNLAQSILDDEIPLADIHRDKLNLLININRRLSYMLNDLIDVTRLKEATITLIKTNVDLASVVNGIFDIIRPIMDTSETSLIMDIPQDFPYIYADENRLIQILFNLIHNGIKFTESGHIIVKAETKGGMAYIKVEDTGIGISEEDLVSIFSPYEQRTLKGEGVGLGLDISKQLVELHDGSLTVESKVKKGSTFCFNMEIIEGICPKRNIILEAKNEVVVLKDTNQDDCEGIRILAIDDNHINLDILRNVLEGAKYHVVTAGSGEEALSILEEGRFDLVISDVMMANISGYELTKRIRKRYSLSELPVLLITARSNAEDILMGFESGANDYVIKPVEALELKTRVKALTDLKQSIEERLRMEATWLQAQIKPHFLFNTLNSIAALGITDIPKMQELLENFSRYLRLSFDFESSKSTVPLQHELDLLESYLYIEKARFGERINVIFQIEDQIYDELDFRIPLLSLQPIVENAIKHGILKKVSGGTIQIIIKEEEDHYQISVEDNGVGIPGEELAKLLVGQEHTKGKSSVGLININRRLKQLYNEELQIESNEGRGTTVSFKVKK